MDGVDGDAAQESLFILFFITLLSPHFLSIVVVLSAAIMVFLTVNCKRPSDMM